MVVMLNSLTKRHLESTDAITVKDFDQMMNGLHDQGFQAINTRQLVDFLENNTRTPLRSAFIMQDGRRYAENFNKHFRPYWEQRGWPVVNAWDSKAVTPDALWSENVVLENEGWVDHEGYGLVVNASMEHLSLEYFTNELRTGMPVIQAHFDKLPVAVVWSGGLSAPAAQAARRVGYRFGFTPNPRGPLMFNWVPLADEFDPSRPAYVPEGLIDDPLMALPRYWPYQILKAVDSVRVTGKEAAAYAEQNKEVEPRYYDIVCASAYGPMQ